MEKDFQDFIDQFSLLWCLFARHFPFSGNITPGSFSSENLTEAGFDAARYSLADLFIAARSLFPTSVKF